MIDETMMMGTLRPLQRGAAAALVFVLMASSASAQVRNDATLSGVVRELGGAPLGNARVSIADPRRSAITSADGAFTMQKIPSGETVRLYIGRIGYRPKQVALVLRPGRNELAFELEPIAHQLDAVRTTVEQTGVFGVVGDTAFEIIAGARVNLTGGVGVTRVTNALGQFAVDTVKPGANLLEVTKEGFKPRLISFTQPAKGGTKLAIWLTPLPAGASAKASDFDNRTFAALFDFKARSRFRRMDAVIVTREMLAKYGPGMGLGDAINALPGAISKGARARDFTAIFVDEIQFPDSTLNSIHADDVELVELYPPGTSAVIQDTLPYRKRRAYTSIRGGAGVSAMPAAPFVARIWLRR